MDRAEAIKQLEHTRDFNRNMAEDMERLKVEKEAVKNHYDFAEALDMAIAALREYEVLENSYSQLQASFDQIYASNMALGAALREQEQLRQSLERCQKENNRLVLKYAANARKGCKYCNGLPDAQREDFTMPNASKKDYDIVTIKFCPMCGRELPEPPREGADHED